MYIPWNEIHNNIKRLLWVWTECQGQQIILAHTQSLSTSHVHGYGEKKEECTKRSRLTRSQEPQGSYPSFATATMAVTKTLSLSEASVLSSSKWESHMPSLSHGCLEAEACKYGLGSPTLGDAEGVLRLRSKWNEEGVHCRKPGFRSWFCN